MFITLLMSPHSNVRDQAVWALGNIAGIYIYIYIMINISLYLLCSCSGDGSECRDYTVRCGIIQPLLSCIQPDISVNICRSSLCLSQLPSSIYRLTIYVMLHGPFLTSVVTRTLPQPWKQLIK